jgi:SAM-dependent methyltransferase
MRPAGLLLIAILSFVPTARAPAAVAQSAAGAQTADADVYEKFRAWIGSQSREAQQGDPLEAYRKVLTAAGVPAAEVERQLRVIDQQGQRLEIDRWNRILTSPNPGFNVKPNAFLVEMVRGVTPGQALDVGMGQGRNAIYLAQQGWTVTGFDPADKAVAAARQAAKSSGVTLTTHVLRDDEFDFGRDKWDLIVLSYVGIRGLTPKLYDSLKPGGRVVTEAFHRDATKTGPIGAQVVYDDNELLKLFDRFRIVRYEDTDGMSDFGLRTTRLVRLCAQKP